MSVPSPSFHEGGALLGGFNDWCDVSSRCLSTYHQLLFNCTLFLLVLLCLSLPHPLWMGVEAGWGWRLKCFTSLSVSIGRQPCETTAPEVVCVHSPVTLSVFERGKRNIGSLGGIYLVGRTKAVTVNLQRHSLISGTDCTYSITSTTGNAFRYTPAQKFSDSLLKLCHWLC